MRLGMVVPPDNPRWLAFLSASSGATPSITGIGKDDLGNVRAAPFVVVLTAGEKVLAGVYGDRDPLAPAQSRRSVALPYKTPVDRSRSRRPPRTLCSEGWIVSQVMRGGSWRSRADRCRRLADRCAVRRPPVGARCRPGRSRARAEEDAGGAGTSRVPSARADGWSALRRTTQTSRRSTTSIWPPAAGKGCLSSRGSLHTDPQPTG